MPTNTPSSPNIAQLDSRIDVNLCNGNFNIDLSPTLFIGTGALNVIGASVKITNPYSVVIKNFPTSGYDIYTPFTSVITTPVPTQAGSYQYGSYSIEIKVTDSDNSKYSIIKSVNICAPDASNKTRKYGTLSAQIDGVCKDGIVYVAVDGVPTYKGVVSTSQVNNFSLEYPTSSGKPVLQTAIGNFSDVLFEGVYKISGTICAKYGIGDNVFIDVQYKIKREKNVRCLLDETCIYARFSQLDEQIKSDCSEAQKQATQDVIISALRLIKTIEISTSAGFDAGVFIDELEEVLGCTCTCNCEEGTPLVNNSPAKNFSITGCNVSKTTTGLTDTYEIENYEYIVDIIENGGALSISAPILTNCTKKQTFTFSISAIYTQLKSQINNSTEFDFWASIINKSWNTINISCLDVTQPEWDAYTYKQRVQAVVDGICTGAGCNATISTNTALAAAADVTVGWTNVSGVYETSLYLDNVFYGTVLAPINSFKFKNAADGISHTYRIVPKCKNGSIGTPLSNSFTFFGCPYIAVPVVSSNSVNSATCPYNLTSLLSGLPLGITAEWHSGNNTNVSSIVANPASASDGTYFVFGKNSDGCYSLPTQVILVCSATTNCSAPQTVIVEKITGGNRVRFQSSAFPPPMNSYTVKRRLTSDPDISGSYTAIGSPSWNVSVSRWEILDATATDNVLYTYRSISNCTSSSPYSDYLFSNIICPSVTLTPSGSSIGYSFPSIGGGVDKIEVRLYQSDGVTLVHTDTFLPSFSNPITGTFTYLTGGHTYNVSLKVYIGTYSSVCGVTSSTTLIGTLAQTSNIASGSTRTQIFQVGPTVAVGSNYGLTVYSHTVNVTAIFGDTPTSIAAALSAAINSTSEVNWNSSGSAPASGTPGFAPTSTSSGNSITLVLNFGNQFAGNVS